jgi:sugar phosphate isomerase/epimerase
VHPLLFSPTEAEEKELLESVARLAEDDFFSVLELAWIKLPTLRKSIREIADSAHISITYAAQLALLSQKLDVNSLNDADRRKAVEEVKSCVDEGYELGAERVSLVSGPDPGEARRNDATRMLIDSLLEICAYGERKGLGITLETFDRAVEKKRLMGPSREAAVLARTVRKEFASFGIMYDMAHGPLLDEDPRKGLTMLKNYLVHIHLGNCVKLAGHPAYGDMHPRFGLNGGEHDVADLTRFLKILFDIGYLGKKGKTNGKLPIVGFEVKPLPGERREAVIAGTKRVWRQAWAQLQQRR